MIEPHQPAERAKEGRSHRSAGSVREYALVALLLAGVALLPALGEALKPVLDRQALISFHKLFYSAHAASDKTFWLGAPLEKNPLDLWVFQEIIYETKPDVIIEAGTYKGGSALFLASLEDLMGSGRVISIDIKNLPGKPSHKRIAYVLGSSTSPAIIEQVRSSIRPGERVMVDLDSNHSKQHVLEEMRAYAPMITIGNYLIVEDTNINGHPVLPEFGPGPMEAVEEFLKENHDFVPDPSREKFLVTFNPGGYLRKVR